MSDRLLEVNDLRTSFFTTSGEVKAVNGVSYYVDRQEIIAIVGESGCGKSVTQMSVMQLIQTPPGKIIGGEVLYEGTNLLKYEATSKYMQDIRGAEISMIFQEPMTALNPVYTVGNQLMEVIRKHKNVSKREARELALKALNDVSIPDAQSRLKNYPFEMSGGMRQRVLIATAIACGSKLIIADEPTTALDVTIQAQVMDLLQTLVDKFHTSLVIVTHNLGLVTRHTQRIYVMYAGRIIEQGTTETLITRPRHPYTIGLLKSVPRLDSQKSEELVPISGAPPNLVGLPDTCAFMPRCPYATDECRESPHPELRNIGGQDHRIACHRDIVEVL